MVMLIHRLLRSVVLASDQTCSNLIDLDNSCNILSCLVSSDAAFLTSRFELDFRENPRCGWPQNVLVEFFVVHG